MCRCGECFGCTLHILSTEHIFSQSDWLEMLEANRAIEYALNEFNPRQEGAEMSLNWDLSKIKDYKDLCWITAEADSWSRGIKAGDEMLNPVTEALIWHTMGVGIGTISEANCGEFYGRVKLVETLHGPSLYGPDGPRPITAEDVTAHIGLSTNVSKTSRAEFYKHHVASYIDVAAREVARKEANCA